MSKHGTCDWSFKRFITQISDRLSRFLGYAQVKTPNQEILPITVFVGLILIILLFSCGPAKEAPRVQYLKVAGPGYSGVIVPANRGREWGNLAEFYWTPSFDDVSEAEKALKTFLETSTEIRHKELTQKLVNYRRQYVGVIKGKERIVFINGFCHWDLDNWMYSPVVVLGGGACYFQSEYNVIEKRCLWAAINWDSDE